MISVTAFGFIGEKPQLQMVGANHQKVEFDVIWPRRVFSAGEWKTVWERATFVAWAEEAEQIAFSLEKGNEVSCTGIQETSEWTDKAGQKRSKVKYKLTAWIKQYNKPPRPQGDSPHAGEHDGNEGGHAAGGRSSEGAGQRHQPKNQQTDARSDRFMKPPMQGAELSSRHEPPARNGDSAKAPVNPGRPSNDYIVM